MSAQAKEIPLLIHSLDLNVLRKRIRVEVPEYSTDNPNYEIIYKIQDDSPGDYVRAIQETEILKTKLKLKDPFTKQVRTLPSFTEVWNDPGSGLTGAILSDKNPHEAKWKLSVKYGYKLATTFMPMYAKSIYEYFGALSVLDPCAGWGDRMVGALSSHCVIRYVGFDPNTLLIPGYKKIMRDFGRNVQIDNAELKHMKFEGGYDIYSLPFEVGIKQLDDNNLFDFAFTSPPFFDYEEYHPENPKYLNWIKEFYEPLFSLTETRLVENAFFALHIDDTSAGNIRDFLFTRVEQITRFQMRGKIGLVGGKSGKIRNVYLFQKTSRRLPI